MTKTTPTQCKLTACHWNRLPPGENSQECIACEGLKRANWKPAGRRPKP